MKLLIYTTWTELKGIIASEKHQSPKIMYRMISFLEQSQFDKITKMENKLVVMEYFCTLIAVVVIRMVLQIHKHTHTLIHSGM